MCTAHWACAGQSRLWRKQGGRRHPVRENRSSDKSEVEARPGVAEDLATGLLSVWVEAHFPSGTQERGFSRPALTR